MANVSLAAATKTFDDDGDQIVAVDELDLTSRTGNSLCSWVRRAVGSRPRSDGGWPRVPFVGHDYALGDEVINDKTPQERDIAMVFPVLRPVSPHDRPGEHGVRA